MSTIKGIDIIRRWVIQTRLKEQTKQGGVMITLPKKEFVDLNTSITADRLLRSGIDIDQITTVGQVDNLINQININTMRRSVVSQDDPRFKGIMEQLMGKKDNVVDMRGQKIPPGSKIMGGEAVDDIPPPGSRGGADDIAEPVQSAEESLKNMIQAENKKNIAAMKQRKMLEEAIEDASPGFANDIKVDADLVAENLAERMGLVYDDLPTKQRLDLYDQAYTGLSKQRFKGMKKPDDDPEEFQKGGIARIGLKDGMNRRTFLKLLTGAISIPIIGKFFKPVKGVGKVAKVPMIKTSEVPGKPEWFDSLVNKVILEGDEVSKKFATKEREIVHRKKFDDNNEVMVYQDLDEGTIRVDYDSPDNMGQDIVSLRFKPGMADETTGGKKPRDEFQATESEPRYVGSPEDTDLEFDGIGGGSDIRMLESDVSKLKEYATGQKPTMKEFVESKKRKDRVKGINEDQMEAVEYISGKYGDGPEPDFDDIENFARGGIAGMLGE